MLINYFMTISIYQFSTLKGSQFHILDVIIIMSQPYQDKQIEAIIAQGAYSKNLQFNKNDNNMLRLIQYITHMQVQKNTLGYILSLIKFYRFPSVILFASLYHKINQIDVESIEGMKDELKNIAAYVNSLLKMLKIRNFKEIHYFFQWGQAKKSFKITVIAQEQQFAEFIIKLSEMKQQIETIANDKTDFKLNEAEQKINAFLSQNMTRQTNILQQCFIDKIKKMCGKAIELISSRSNRLPIKLQVKHQKQKIVMKQQSSISNKKVSQSFKLPEINKQYETNKNINQKLNTNRQKTENKPLLISKKKDDQDEADYRNQSFIFISKKKVTPICCRPYFYDNQCLEQPQSIRVQYKHYTFPFVDNFNQYPGKAQKIKRTLCGMLNAEGGIIYFGIKQMVETRKRLVAGYYISEKRKIQFKKQIYRLLQNVKPDVGKRCEIKWVPIKSKANSNFLNGKYVAKVIIDRGAKEHIYSYLQQNGNRIDQKFAFKTQNEVVMVTQAQKILKMFRYKFQKSEAQWYPVHEGRCEEPEIGKQVFDNDDDDQQGYQNYADHHSYANTNRYYDDYSYQQKQQKSKKSFALVETNKNLFYQKTKGQKIDRELIPTQKKLFKQKQSCQYLIKGATERQLADQNFTWKQIKHINKYLYVLLNAQKDIENLPYQYECLQLYSRLSYRKINDNQMLNTLKIVICQSIHLKDRSNGIISFDSTQAATQFYLQLLEMNIKLEFTSEA